MGKPNTKKKRSLHSKITYTKNFKKGYLFLGIRAAGI